MLTGWWKSKSYLADYKEAIKLLTGYGCMYGLQSLTAWVLIRVKISLNAWVKFCIGGLLGFLKQLNNLIILTTWAALPRRALKN